MQPCTVYLSITPGNNQGTARALRGAHHAIQLLFDHALEHFQKSLRILGHQERVGVGLEIPVGKGFRSAIRGAVGEDAAGPRAGLPFARVAGKSTDTPGAAAWLPVFMREAQNYQEANRYRISVRTPAFFYLAVAPRAQPAAIPCRSPASPSLRTSTVISISPQAPRGRPAP